MPESKGWDPLARIGQVKDRIAQGGWSTPVGLVEGALLPFEALGTGIKYGVGVVTGAEQALLEKGVSALQGKPYSAARTVDHGWFGQHELPKVGNVFDPQEAIERYDALVPGPLDMAIQTLVGSKGSGLLAAGTKKAGEQAIERGPAVVRKILDPASAPLEALGVPQAVALGDAGLAKATGPVARAAVTGVAAVGGALEEPDMDIAERLKRGALFGLGATGLTLPMAMVNRRIARATVNTFDDFHFSDNLDSAVAERLKAQKTLRYQQDGNFNPLWREPGGQISHMIDHARENWTDRLAHMQTWTKRVEQIKGEKLTPDENSTLLARMINGIPDRAKSIMATELRPVFKAAGLTQAGLIRNPKGVDYEALLYTFQVEQNILNRAARGEKPIRMTDFGVKKDAAGVETYDPALALVEGKQYVNGVRAEIDHQLGLGTVDRWTIAAKKQTDIITDRGLSQLVDAELISAEDFINIKRDRTVYAVVEDLSTRLDALEADFQAPPGRSLVATSRGADYVHPDINVTGADFDATMGRLEHLLTLAQRNKVGQALVKNRDIDPQGMGNFMRPWDANAYRAAGMDPALAERGFTGGRGGMERVPEGLARVPVYLKAERTEWLVPKYFADELYGKTDVAMGNILEVLGKWSQFWRSGITSLSLPFLYHNIPRDYQTALQNSKMPLSFMREYQAAWMENLTKGLDDWMSMRKDDPLVLRLPTYLWEGAGHLAKKAGLEEKLIGERMAGRSLEVGGSLGSTLTSQVRSGGRILGEQPGEIRKVLGIQGEHLRFSPSIVLTNITDAMAEFSQIAESSTRLAVFRAAVKSGVSDVEAGMLERTLTTDFSKGGNVMKALSYAAPLLNARVQGELQSAQSALEDPYGYATRLTMSAVVPAIGLYGYNRGTWGDLYDKIPQEEKDQNFIIGLGTYTDDRGETQLIRAKIAKNQITALVVNPIERFMDTVYHVEHGRPAVRFVPKYERTPLAPDQRSMRDEGQMFLQGLMSWLPINVNADDVFNPIGYGMGILTLNPITGTIAQMAGNKNQFFNKPIVPDDKMTLPPEYQYDNQTHVAYKLLSEGLKAIDAPEGFQKFAAPMKTQFMVRGFGGTATDLFIGSADTIWEWAQDNGFAPISAFKPQTLDDLKIPAGASREIVEESMNQLEGNDLRPGISRLLPFIFGTSGAGTSVTARLAQLSPDERAIWKDTRSVLTNMEAIRAQNSAKIQEIYEMGRTGDRTQEQMIKLVFDVRTAQRFQMDALASPTGPYSRAITDEKDRRVFMAKLPGMPVDVNHFRPSSLPPETDVAALWERYSRPPGVDMTKLSKVGQVQAKSRELARMANEMNVSQPVLRDYIAAYGIQTSDGGAYRGLPVVGLPALDLEYAVEDFRHPIDPEAGPIDPKTGKPAGEAVNPYENPEKIALLRNLQIGRLAQKWGVSEQGVTERIKARLTSPDENDSDSLSFERANYLSGLTRDPQNYPRYVAANGQPLGINEAEWANYDAIIMSAAGTPAAKRPPVVQMLEAAKKNAEFKRQAALSADDNYIDYARWFGIGRKMTTEQWDKYLHGDYKRYTVGGPPDWFQFDALQRLYRTMPAGPAKQRLQPMIKRIADLSTKEGQIKMLLDDQAQKQVEWGPYYEELSGLRESAAV